MPFLYFIVSNTAEHPIFTIKDCGKDNNLRWDYNIQVLFTGWCIRVNEILNYNNKSNLYEYINDAILIQILDQKQ